jgi:hypothetical protein
LSVAEDPAAQEQAVVPKALLGQRIRVSLPLGLLLLQQNQLHPKPYEKPLIFRIISRIFRELHWVNQIPVQPLKDLGYRQNRQCLITGNLSQSLETLCQIYPLPKLSKDYPAPFAEGGRVGDERVRPRPDTTSDPSVTDDSVSTDLSRFTKMLKDLMMMPSGSVDSQGKENSFGVSDKPQARRPLIPGGLIPPETGSPRYGGDAEAFRFKEQFDVTAGSPLNIIPEGARPEIEVERLAPPVAPAESTPTMDSEFNLSRRELTAFNTLTREGFSGREAMDRVKRMTPEQLDLMVEVANSPDGFKNGGETRRPAPGLLQDNPQRTATVEKLVRDKMESLGLTQEEAVKELQAMFRKTYPMSETVPDYSFAGGGSVRGRRDALPLVEGDHVVPAHAVKGNEGGLAALSKKLMGNQSYDGMIRGPGGPREDAIKTRVYAAGGGISGKMDNLQNPFNSVPARVSNKEYVIPRQAITNLGMMNGAREGDANKVGQDIIYQLVENLKRKA